jgi:hypothetical protein
MRFAGRPTRVPANSRPHSGVLAMVEPSLAIDGGFGFLTDLIGI